MPKIYLQLNDVGSGEVTVPIEQEVPLGGYIDLSYRGQTRFLFRVDSRKYDYGKSTVTLSGRGPLALLEEAVVWPEEGGASYRTFAAPLGKILALLIDEAQSRGALANIIPTFTEDETSDHNSWGDDLELKIPVGISLLEIARRLVEMGYDVTTTVREDGKVLLGIYSQGIGEERPGVLFSPGLNCESLEYHENALEIRNALCGIGADGAVVEVSDSGSITEYGRREGAVLYSASGTSTLSSLLNRELSRSEQPQTTITLRVIDCQPKAFVDYSLGDWVYVDIGGTPQKWRVVGMQLDWDKSGYATIDLTLNSVQLEEEIKMARALEGMRATWSSFSTSVDASGVQVHDLDPQAHLGVLGGIGKTVTVAAYDAPEGWRTFATYKCDGVADQIEINQAIAALGTGGGTIVLSPGTFNLRVEATPWPSDGNVYYSILISNGVGPVLLRGTGWSTVLQVDDTTTNATMIEVGGSSQKRTVYTCLENFKIVGGFGTGRPSIHVAYAENVSARGIYFDVPPHMGIQFVRLANNGLVENCYFACTNGKCGVRFESRRGIVRNNFFYGNPTPASSDTALLSIACDADISVQAEDVLAIGNIFYQNFIGLHTTGKRINILGNCFYGQYNLSGARAVAVSGYSGAVNFGATETLISGNTFVDCRYGVALTSGATSDLFVKRVSVIGNTINNGTGISGHYAIYESGSYVDENSIIGNTIYGNWIGTIRVVGANTFAANNVEPGGMRLPLNSQMKLGFFGATPIPQPTTSIEPATFVENSGTPININSTFDGYTIAQYLRGLRKLGLMA